MRFLVRYKFSLCVVAAIVYLCFFTPPETSLGEITNFDKFVHFSMYFLFTAVIWHEYLLSHRGGFTISWLSPKDEERRPMSRLRLVVGALLAPIAFSGLIELGQKYLTTTRSGEWWDFAANSTGALLTFITFSIIIAVKKHRKNG